MSRSQPSPVVRKPEGGPFGEHFDVYRRTDGMCIVVDLRLPPAKRTVGTFANEESAVAYAKNLAAGMVQP